MLLPQVFLNPWFVEWLMVTTWYWDTSTCHMLTGDLALDGFSRKLLEVVRDLAPRQQVCE